MDAIDDDADKRAAAISQRIPIALIDRRTLEGLQRLGIASPARGAQSLYQAPEQPDAIQPALVAGGPPEAGSRRGAATPRLLRRPCRRRVAARRPPSCAAGAKVPPEPHTAGVWLYADALLSGKLQLGDATLVMRAVALAQAEDQAPPDLLATLASDVARFV